MLEKQNEKWRYHLKGRKNMSDIAQNYETNKSHYSELGWVVLNRVESLQQGYLNDSPQARADLAELRKASQDL